VRLHADASEHKLQQWRKFLLNPKNKKAFRVCGKGVETGLIQNKVNKQGHFSCERDCYEITSQATNIVEELNPTQEEADTRLIARLIPGLPRNAAHAAKSRYKAAVVASEDTDVFLLCLAFNCFIRHPCISSVECRQELDMSVSPVWWQP